METIKIDIINPEAKALLKDLANLDLIRIRKSAPEFNLDEILAKFRKNASNAPTLEKITNELEEVRKARYFFGGGFLVMNRF